MLLAAPAFAEVSLTPHKAVYKLKISVAGGRLVTQMERTDEG